MGGVVLLLLLLSFAGRVWMDTWAEDMCYTGGSERMDAQE